MRILVFVFLILISSCDSRYTSQSNDSEEQTSSSRKKKNKDPNLGVIGHIDWCDCSQCNEIRDEHGTNGNAMGRLDRTVDSGPVEDANEDNSKSKIRECLYCGREFDANKQGVQDDCGKSKNNFGNTIDAGFDALTKNYPFCSHNCHDSYHEDYHKGHIQYD